MCATTAEMRSAVGMGTDPFGPQEVRLRGEHADHRRQKTGNADIPFRRRHSRAVPGFPDVLLNA